MIFTLNRKVTTIHSPPWFEFGFCNNRHWDQDKMDATFLTTFSNKFPWMKILRKIQFKFHWNLFPRVQLTIMQYWFRQWLGTDKATRHYINRWWPHLLTHICVTRLRWVKSLHLAFPFCLTPTTMIVSVSVWNIPDGKVHVSNMGPTWVLSAPDGPMLAPWTLLSGMAIVYDNGMKQWNTQFVSQHSFDMIETRRDQTTDSDDIMLYIRNICIFHTRLIGSYLKQ